MAQRLGTGEDIRRDDLDQQASELALGEAHAVERFELFAKVLLQRLSVADVWAVTVFELAKPIN